jgi:hypothetical protein
MTANARTPTCPDCKQELKTVICHHDYSQVALLDGATAVRYSDESVNEFTDATCPNCGAEVTDLVELPYLDKESES